MVCNGLVVVSLFMDKKQKQDENKMKTREKIRMQFSKENNGINWTNSQEEPDIDYVYWLEDRLIAKSITPVIIEKKENLCLCNWPLMHTRENGAKYCGICQKDI
jgi:hypothetical protein